MKCTVKVGIPYPRVVVGADATTYVFTCGVRRRVRGRPARNGLEAGKLPAHPGEV